jgi:hypothetical protein
MNRKGARSDRAREVQIIGDVKAADTLAAELQTHLREYLGH